MRKYFITGLLILVPLAITVWVLSLVINTMDQSLLLLPEQWRPENLIGYRIPGLGTILTIAIVFFTGLLAVYVFYFVLGWAPAPLDRDALPERWLPPELTATGWEERATRLPRFGRPWWDLRG